jgi:O-acetyl-ADP-ribose deacetylase (regulator of RNase III)
MLKEFLDGHVIAKVGDITQEPVDAIVNAANSSLFGGGGVDGAIHAKGGSKILEECREIRRTQYPNGLPTGEAVVTTAGNLPARFVIHTVGPVYGMNRGRDAELLAACYKNSLQLAVENNLITVAFPAISTGIFGYPKDEAARVSSDVIKEFLARDSQVQEVRLVFFGEADGVTFLKHCRFPS